MSAPTARNSAALSAQGRATREKASEAWLALLCDSLPGARSGLVLLPAAEQAGAPESWAVCARWPDDGSEFSRLLEVGEAAVSKNRSVVRPHPKPADADAADVHDIGHPIDIGGEIVAVVAVEVDECPEPRLPQVIRQIQRATSSLSMMLRTGASRHHHPATGGRGLETALWLMATALEHESFHGAAMAAATDLASHMDCDRVSIGFLDGLQMKAHALSHSAEFGERMNVVRRIEAAMDEAYDQQISLAVPTPKGSPVAATVAHAELAEDDDSRSACTVLLGWNDRVVGAMTLERAQNRPFQPGEIETLEDIAALLGPILELKRRDDRWLVYKAWDELRAQAEKLVGPRHLGMKLVAGALAAVVLLLAIWPGNFRITADATLEGEIMRAAVAPLDGFIVDAPIRAGEVVEAGQLLAVLDDRELRLELSNWQSQHDQVESEYLEAMAERDRVQMNLLRARMDQAAAQIGLIEEQLARMTIEAPIDGLVVSGDLSQSIGAPVEQGDVLFEVAPLDSYRLMLRVDERDIVYLDEGQSGQLVLAAMPETRHEFTVERITPVSTAEEGVNYFLVEANLAEAPDLLRPGMEGVGKVEVGRRQLLWIWTRRITDWLRLWVWSWWGSGP